MTDKGAAIGSKDFPEECWLDPTKLEAALTEDYSEYKRRQGVAVSEGAGTFQHGGDALLKAGYFGDVALGEDALEKLTTRDDVLSAILRLQKKTGIFQIGKIFETRDGQSRAVP